MQLNPNTAGTVPAPQTITEAQAAEAFSLWEAHYRNAPEGFMTADEVARLSTAQFGEGSAIYFMALLRQVKAAA